jgi:ADP-heptose:LPS heptosyltransferase
VPGSSAHRPGKRWPAEGYGALAHWLVAQGITPVVVGTKGEAPLGAVIKAAESATIDLTGGTTLPELTELARKAMVAIGNDTGPMHLAAAAGCPCIVLFSGDSDPALCAPRGRWVQTLRREKLGDLALTEVTGVLESALAEMIV